jgi:hypothetical protein
MLDALPDVRRVPSRPRGHLSLPKHAEGDLALVAMGRVAVTGETSRR